MHSFNYNGIDFGSNTYGLIVVGYSQHSSMADIRRESSEQGAADGDIDYAVNLKAKFHTLECVVKGENHDDLTAKMDRIKKALNPKNGLKWLQLDHWTALDSTRKRGCWARLDGPILDHFTTLGTTFQLNFYVPSGKDLALADSTRSAANVNATIYEPSGASDVIGGTDDALAIWTINASGTSSGDITLANANTGETFTWTGSLVSGEKLRIDAVRQYADKYTGGEWIPAMSNVSAASPFPKLKCGERNAITVAGVTGTLDISYRVRFL